MPLAESMAAPLRLGLVRAIPPTPATSCSHLAAGTAVAAAAAGLSSASASTSFGFVLGNAEEALGAHEELLQHELLPLAAPFNGPLPFDEIELDRWRAQHRQRQAARKTHAAPTTTSEPDAQAGTEAEAPAPSITHDDAEFRTPAGTAPAHNINFLLDAASSALASLSTPAASASSSGGIAVIPTATIDSVPVAHSMSVDAAAFRAADESPSFASAHNADGAYCSCALALALALLSALYILSID